MGNLKNVNVLVIDPQRSMRNSLKERLLHEGFQVEAFETLDEGYAACRTKDYDLLLIDGDLADEHTGSARHGAFGNVFPIILAENPSLKTVVYSIREGAWDFVPKPVDMNDLLFAIRSALEMRAAEQKYSRPRKMVIPEKAPSSLDDDGSGIIGRSEPIKQVKKMVDLVGPKDVWVMITGPNGSGKELVAKLLHQKSSRAAGPFVEVNCAAIPSELIESELFGHEKGSFSSAIRQHKGKFEQAHGGTLFLDEVGDMSLSAQAKVLRALQEQKITRVGGDGAIDVDVRVISATNKDVVKEIDAGHFREDLFHRLSVIEIYVPPLTKRQDDIPLLVDYFIDKLCKEYEMDLKEIEPDALELLKNHGWTGNVRELKNVVERLIVLCGEKITEQNVKDYVIRIRRNSG